MDLGERRSGLNRLLGLWDVLVDPRVGIVKEVYELPIEEDDPNFFHMLSTSCDTSRFSSLKNFGNNGGVSTDRYTAIAKAVGEAVERYCSALFDYDDLQVAAFEDLRVRATPPGDYAHYREDQLADGLPWAPFTDSTPVAWTRGRSLHDGGEVLIPAAMVYVPYHYIRGRGDAPIVQPISTGLALGSSYDRATLGGLCEVIERDAFTITWQARLQRRRVRAESLPASGRDLLGRFADVGLDVAVMDITSDVPLPTLLVVARGEAATSPAIAVAAATDPSAEVALTKALEELAHTRKFAKQLMEYTPDVPVEPDAGHPAVQDQRDHLRFYCPQASKEYAAFLWSSSEEVDFADVIDHGALDERGAVQLALDGCAAAGLQAHACDLTSSDVRELGLSCVRVVVPGMHPLQMGHRNRSLGGRRLYEVPRKLGFQGIEAGAPDNPYPHAFP